MSKAPQIRKRPKRPRQELPPAPVSVAENPVSVAENIVRKEPRNWLRAVEVAATALSAVASAFAVYVAVTSLNVQKLQSDAADANRKRDLAVQDAAVQTLLARQLKAENSAAQARLQDTAQRAGLTVTQLTLANVELRTRTQDVIAARAELERVNMRVASTETERRVALDNLGRAQLSAFVTAHLNRVYDLAVRERDRYVMLADPADTALAAHGFQFRVFISRLESPNPDWCVLSALHVMRIVDGDPKSPAHAAMCAYLQSTGVGHKLGHLVDSDYNFEKQRESERWEDIGEIPYTLSISSEPAFEDVRVRVFWRDMDVGGFLMVPGARKMLDSLALPQSNAEAAALLERINQFEGGWTPYVARLRSLSYWQEQDSADAPGAPPLVPIARVSLQSLRRGEAQTTRSFERALLCDAGWYAEQHGLIEAYSRQMYCTPY